jgi:Undecaprenyl-phosphate glucose phosphotransferase
VLIAAAVVAFAAHFPLIGRSAVELGRYVWATLFAATLFVGSFERLGGYRLNQLLRLHWQITRTLMMWSVTLSVLLLVIFAGNMLDSYSNSWALAWLILAPTLFLIGRGVLYFIATRWVQDGRLARNIVIVGAGNEGQRLITKLSVSHDKSIAFCGVYDDRQIRLPSSILGHDVLGTTDDLVRVARRVPIDEVIIAMPLNAEERLKELFWKLKGVAIDLRLSVEPMVEKFDSRGLSHVGTVSVLDIADRPLKNWRAVVKWLEDKLLSVFFITILGPLMALAAVLIKADSPGPVFFIQERFGFNNDVINILKFRTMYIDRCDASGARRTVQNDPRVTRVGRILRALSIDELPQLLNVLRGEMSVIGPRAHAVAMRVGDRLYGDAVRIYIHRHRVKPGITGWAQVNGLRGEVDTLEKACARVAHDIYYIDHWSFWLDCKILLKTAKILMSRDKAY